MLGNFWQGTGSMLGVLKDVIQILRNALTLKVITVFDSLSRFKKQSSRGVLQKRCSYIFCEIHRKTPVPESLF